MNTLKVAIYLLSLASCWPYALMWDKEYVLSNILAISRVIQVQEVNWFISEQMDTNGSENFQDFFNTIHRETAVTQMILTNSDGKVRMSQTSSRRKYLGMVMTSGADDPIMKLHARILQGRRIYTNFIVLFKPQPDLSEVDRLLYELDENNFVHSFLYVQYSNKTSGILGKTRYPKSCIYSYKNSFLLNKIKRGDVRKFNCAGCKLQVPLRLDLPEVFTFVNNKNLIEQHGISLEILKRFTKNINGSLVNYDTSDHLSSNSSVVNMKDVLQLIRGRKIPIAANAYAFFKPDETIDKGPALTLIKWCLMVPLHNNVSQFHYPILPFEWKVWCAILLAYLVLVITDCLWLRWEGHKVTRPKSKSKLNISASFMNNLCCLLFIHPCQSIERPSIIRFLLYATVFFHAIFISIGYTSTLGSIVTVTSVEQHIDTMEDLIKAKLPTMIIDYELEFLLELNMDLPKDFLSLMVPVDPVTFHMHRTNFNQSYAYFVADHQWRFLRQQQDHLKWKLFKFTDICFGTFILSFPMEIDSPFEIVMQRFIFHLHAAGMFTYFEESSFAHALRAGYVQHFKSDEIKLSHLRQFSLIFLALFISSCVSGIVFLCECLVHKLKRK